MRPDHAHHIYRSWLYAISGGRAAAAEIDARGSTPERERALAAWVDAAATAEGAMRQTCGAGVAGARMKLIMALDALVSGAAGDLADPAWQLVLSAFADLDDGDGLPGRAEHASPPRSFCLDG